MKQPVVWFGFLMGVGGQRMDVVFFVRGLSLWFFVCLNGWFVFRCARGLSPHSMSNLLSGSWWFQTEWPSYGLPFAIDLLGHCYALLADPLRHGSRPLDTFASLDKHI